MRAILFNALRLYVWFAESAAGRWILRWIPAVRQSRAIIAAVRASIVVIRWFRGKRPDVILEPLPRPDDDVPEVHDAPSLFLSGDGRAAYFPQGQTLRRAALNDEGELVFIKRANKCERRALKRAKRRDGTRTKA